jgi:hypothetical protein
MTKKDAARRDQTPSGKERTLQMNPTFIIRAKRQVVKLAITADLVLLLAAIGSLNIPATFAALLVLNLLCGLYFKEETRHENV